MNNKLAANQLVPHAHFHVIPRFENDGVASSWKSSQYDEGEMEEYTNAIKKLI